MMTGSDWLSNDTRNRLDNDDRFWLTAQWYEKQTIDNDDYYPELEVVELVQDGPRFFWDHLLPTAHVNSFLPDRGRKHVIRSAEDFRSRFFVFFIVKYTIIIPWCIRNISSNWEITRGTALVDRIGQLLG